MYYIIAAYIAFTWYRATVICSYIYFLSIIFNLFKCKCVASTDAIR